MRSPQFGLILVFCQWLVHGKWLDQQRNYGMDGSRQTHDPRLTTNYIND